MKSSKKARRNSDSGITLVALVITVIVLLILAGTTIALAIDSGDLFGKAREAANDWNDAVDAEETVLNNYIDMLDDY